MEVSVESIELLFCYCCLIEHFAFWGLHFGGFFFTCTGISGGCISVEAIIAEADGTKAEGMVQGAV